MQGKGRARRKPSKKNVQRKNESPLLTQGRKESPILKANLRKTFPWEFRNVGRGYIYLFYKMHQRVYYKQYITNFALL